MVLFFKKLFSSVDPAYTKDNPFCSVWKAWASIHVQEAHSQRIQLGCHTHRFDGANCPKGEFRTVGDTGDGGKNRREKRSVNENKDEKRKEDCR